MTSPSPSLSAASEWRRPFIFAEAINETRRLARLWRALGRARDIAPRRIRPPAARRKPTSSDLFQAAVTLSPTHSNKTKVRRSGQQTDFDSPCPSNIHHANSTLSSSSSSFLSLSFIVNILVHAAQLAFSVSPARAPPHFWRWQFHNAPPAKFQHSLQGAS